MLVAILGDVAHAGAAAAAHRGMGDVLPQELDAAAAHTAEACQGVHQLGLAIALNARQTENLPPAHGEGHVLDGVALVELGGHREVGDLQHHRPGLGRGLCRW